MISERQKYISAYNKKRYHSDKKFRRSIIKSVKKSFKKRSLVWKEKGLCPYCGRSRNKKKFVLCEKCRVRGVDNYQKNKLKKNDN